MSPRLHTLANGVRVICDPAVGYETLALSVVAGRGARWEDEARSGWSHLLEHMVFKGAGARSARDIVEVIEAQGGHINAATGYERTSFQVRALRGGLPLAMAVTADLILAPTLRDDDLAREKLVVGQEIAEAADTPDDLVFEMAQTSAFADQPLGRPVLGTVASIGRASPDTLESWRARLYAPDRLVVSAAGAVDEDELLRETERLFGAAAAPSADEAAQGRFTGGAVGQARRLEQAHLVFLLPAPGVKDEDYFALRLFAEVLGGGMSSRLFQEARERLGLAYAIDAYAETYADVGTLGIYAGCAARDAGRLAEVAAQQIRGMVAGLDEAELARAKAQLKGSLFMARESLVARAEQAAGQVLVFGRTLTSAELAEAIDRVSLADMARLGGRLLSPGKATVSMLGSKPALDAAPRFEAALFG
ncbi:MAG TPA: pitrilysin family protein [Caulobacteraceae bacterium]|nr:pitrilysin family protein [Caulobacteraceae bacterium]